jgi:beta-lactamase superfamily II metal-dependent hydrolase
MKVGNDCLVIDVGSGKKGRNPLQQYQLKIKKDGLIYRRLKDINVGNLNCILLLTHNHADHFCLFPEFKKILDAQTIKVPARRNYPYLTPHFLAEAFCAQYGEQVVEASLPYGGYVHVYCLPPPQNAQKVHEKNLVVFVRYGRVLFIFPGDADGDYLDLNAQAFVDALKEQSEGCARCCIVPTLWKQ